MRDFSEFRRHWRPLTASVIGMASALSFNTYVVTAFAPYFLKEFGWSKSEWTLLGLPQFLILLFVPLAGRLTDMFGVRRVAAIGMVAYPLTLVAITMMRGALGEYLAIYVCQVVFCSTTTSAIYSRLAAENFRTWRGVALAICGSGPAIVAMIGTPLITALAESEGWRVGYLAVALYSAVGGITTFLLIPRGSAAGAGPRVQHAAAKPKGVYGRLARQPVLWTLLGAAFLVNVPHALATTQLKLLVLDQGTTDAAAALLLSAFAAGVTLGRIASGVALDYLPSHVVAAVGLGLPLPGLLLLASSYDSMPALTVAILCMGLAFGGEGDVLAYLVVRYFGIEVFSTVLGLVTAAIATAMASGTMVLGIILSRTNSFDPYLWLASGAVFAGSLLLLSMGRHRPQEDADGHVAHA